MDKKDVILLLLNYGGIRGKTIMRMQVFLAYTEIFKEKMPGTDIENEITDLINEGKIIRYNRGEGHAAYYITDKGVEYIKKVKQNISNDTLIKLGNNKVDWDGWGLMGIALYISRNYPEYTGIEEKYRWKFEKCRCGHDYSWHRQTVEGKSLNCMEKGCECKEYNADIRFNALIDMLKEKNKNMANILINGNRGSLDSIMAILDEMQDEIIEFTVEGENEAPSD